MWILVIFVKAVNVSCTLSFSIESSVKFVKSDKEVGVMVEWRTEREVNGVNRTIDSKFGKIFACSMVIRSREVKVIKSEDFMILPKGRLVFLKFGRCVKLFRATHRRSRSSKGFKKSSLRLVRYGNAVQTDKGPL